MKTVMFDAYRTYLTAIITRLDRRKTQHKNEEIPQLQILVFPSHTFVGSKKIAWS